MLEAENPEVATQIKEQRQAEMEAHAAAYADPKATTESISKALRGLLLIGYSEFTVTKVSLRSREFSKVPIHKVWETIQPIETAITYYDALPDKSELDEQLSKLSEMQKYKQHIDELILQVPATDNFDLKIYYDAMKRIYPFVKNMPNYQVPAHFKDRFIAYALFREQ